MNANDTITLTFCEIAENHNGMQKIGKETENGFTYNQLHQIEQKLIGKNIKTEMVELGDNACVLILRKPYFVDADNLYTEQKGLKWDVKAYMRGRVVFKRARYNLCYSDFSQTADYENKKGTVVDFKDLDYLNRLRLLLPEFLGEKAEKLQAEGNLYYDKKCYIGFHGDTERKIVIGVRLGSTMELYYRWFKDTKPVSEMIEIKLNHGDVYVMSEKAGGGDWKTRKIKTLRHCAGNINVLRKLGDIYKDL